MHGLVALVWICLGCSDTPDGKSIVRDMLLALEPIKSIQLIIDSELTIDGKTETYSAQVKASGNPDRYWSKFVGSGAMGIQYVAWNGQTMRYTGDDGKRAEDAVPTLRVVENYASNPAYYGWKIFFDRDIYRNVPDGGCLYIHSEPIEGHECDVVGIVGRSTRNGEETATVQYLWVDRETHLPRAYQYFFLGRGKSGTAPKMMLKDTVVNPVWAVDPFTDVPATVAQTFVQKPGAKVAASAPPELRAGQMLPDVIVQDSTYKPIRLRQLVKGHTLITFWAPWCGPCQAELDALRGMNDFKSGKLKVVAISVFDSKANAFAFARRRNLPFKVVVDPDCEKTKSKLADAFGVSGIPHAFLCDGTGKVVREWLGFTDVAGLLAEIRG